MFRFDAAAYGPGFQFADRPLDRLPANPLGPGVAQQPMRSTLAAFDIDQAFAPHRIVDADAAQCCLSGLWLRYDFLDQSHEISQRIETPSGSFWHGIMHRREPDYGNAKYWFRRAGRHPVFEALLASARHETINSSLPALKALVEQSAWDPYRFVDLCQEAANDRGELQLILRTIALREWELLFDDCYRQAIGDDRR
jgi:hypothetical protein